MSDEPLFDLLDLLGRRHALAALWELRGAPYPFGALASALGAPASVLTQRLRELREAGLVEVDEAGDYRLTTHGRRLQGYLEPLAAYADQWVSLSPRQRSPRGSTDRGRGE
ncbi:MAG: winged helix-turn-helix transcriptional regulator [Mycobacteriales bacterium]